jgi:hypothetical protein
MIRNKSLFFTLVLMISQAGQALASDSFASGDAFVGTVQSCDDGSLPYVAVIENELAKHWYPAANENAKATVAVFSLDRVGFLAWGNGSADGAYEDR